MTCVHVFFIRSVRYVVVSIPLLIISRLVDRFVVMYGREGGVFRSSGLTPIVLALFESDDLLLCFTLVFWRFVIMELTRLLRILLVK